MGAETEHGYAFEGDEVEGARLERIYEERTEEFRVLVTSFDRIDGRRLRSVCAPCDDWLTIEADAERVRIFGVEGRDHTVGVSRVLQTAPEPATQLRSTFESIGGYASTATQRTASTN